MSSSIALFGDGVTDEFDVPFSYISRDHVEFRSGDTIVAPTWLTGSRVKFPTAPALGDIVTMTRRTPTTTRMVSWGDGGGFQARDINTAFNQVFFSLEEAQDRIGGSQVSFEITAYGLLTANIVSQWTNAIVVPTILLESFTTERYKQLLRVEVSGTCDQAFNLTIGCGSFPTEEKLYDAINISLTDGPFVDPIGTLLKVNGPLWLRFQPRATSTGNLNIKLIWAQFAEGE